MVDRPIDFRQHEIRFNQAGATEDFEAMLEQLVRASHGEGHRVWANPGDGGIDVFIGDLDGDLTVFQAKYFMNGVGKSQQSQIRKSFGRAQADARSKPGCQIVRWVLCVPSDLDQPTRRWWNRWSADRQSDTGTRLELWARGELIELLNRDEAVAVRRAWYGDERTRSAAPELRLAVAPRGHRSTVSGPWRAGELQLIGGDAYMLHDGAEEQAVSDTRWLWRDAPAVDPAGLPVWLRQVAEGRPGRDGEDLRTGLRAQAHVLSGLRGGHGLPTFVAFHDEAVRSTLVLGRRSGARWSARFGPGPVTDRLMAADVVRAAAGISQALAQLHALGSAHGRVDPSTIVVDTRGTAWLVHAGDCGLPPGVLAAPGTAAPEQLRSPYPVNPAVDCYLVAALVYETMSGTPPSWPSSPPLVGAVPGWPTGLDTLLAECLAADPAARPPDLEAVAARLEEARYLISTGPDR